MSKIYIIRHAQASYLSDNYDRLSDMGLQQAAYLGDYLSRSGIVFDRIMAGPLERQQHTCQIVSETYSKQKITQPPAITIPELKEHEGPRALRNLYNELIRTSDRVKFLNDQMSEDPSLKRKNSLLIFEYFISKWMDDIYVDPKTESFTAFKANLYTWLESFLSSLSGKETIGIFTSGGTIATIIAYVLGLEKGDRMADLNYRTKNVSISQLNYHSNKLSMESFNEVHFLPGDMVSYV